MTVENPTGSDAGASISARIENYLAAADQQPSQSPQSARQDDEPPKAQPIEEAAPKHETPAKEATEAPAGDDTDEGDGPQISLSDVAQLLGIDESALDIDEDGGIKIKTKIDGKEGAAKFNDLIKSYQVQGHADAKAREAAEQAKALHERVQQFETYAQQEAQKLSQLANIAQQELMRDAANIDWNDLAMNDPAGYVAQQHVFQQRQARVNQLLTEANQQQANLQQANQAKYTQTLQAEAQRLSTLIPEWGDAKVAEAEKGELRTWALAQGFTDQDLSGLTRADVVSMMRKAMLFDKGKVKATEIADKKIRTAPKLVKPGQSMDAGQRAKESTRALKENIRKSGGRSGIAEYLLATGKV